MRDFLAIIGAFTLLNILFAVINWIGDNWSWWLGPLTLWSVVIWLIAKMVKISRGEN